MNHANPETIINIEKAALAEFIDKGFAKASLRTIVKQAGVTTGAFYGYFKTKEELFDKLAGDAAHSLMAIYDREYAISDGADRDEIIEIYKKSEFDKMRKLMKYAFDNPEKIKLIVCGSDGTRYENFFHELTEVATKHTLEIMKYLKIDMISEEFTHIIISGNFKSFCELIEHDYSRCDAGIAMNTLGQFYVAGWVSILKKE